MEPKPLTKEDHKIFQDWIEALKEANRSRKGFDLSKSHLFQCPYLLRAELSGTSLVPNNSQVFTYWSPAILNYLQGTRYIGLREETKYGTSSPKLLVILTSYCDNPMIQIGERKGQENTWTLLHEPLGNNRIITKDVAVHDAKTPNGSIPIALNDDHETKANKVAQTKNAQQRIAPLGKRGVLSFHSITQFMPLTNVRGGTFQRFFDGPNPESQITRVAHALRKLAGADPKTTPKGAKRLLEELQRELTRSAVALIKLIEEARNAPTIEPFHLCKSGEILPKITLKDGHVRTCWDVAYGMRANTNLLSLQVGTHSSTETQNELAFQENWKALAK